MVVAAAAAAASAASVGVGVGALPLLAAAATLAAALCFTLLLLFAKADCDLGLYLSGPAPKDAFRGKVVWITGASQGLGEELARRLAAQGARLVLTSRSEEKLSAVARALPPNNNADASSSPVVLPLDLASASQDEFERAAARADAAFGGQGVDVLLHVAGGSQHSLAPETSDAVADAVFALNALGPIKLTRAALPYLMGTKGGGVGRAGGTASGAAGSGKSGAEGSHEQQQQQQQQAPPPRPIRRVVAVCSAAAVCPSPGEAVYSGAKAALLGYLRSLASEVADSPVRVTIALPGPIATGTDDKPRVIFGASGVQAPPAPGAPKRSKKGRLDPGRCADLVLAAAAHGRDEAWLSRHPVLLLMHVMQFLPPAGRALMRMVGPKRARGMHTGESSGYDVRALLFGGAKGKSAAAANKKAA
jgi:dehydrogenase/reductase SDR family member 7